LLVAQYFDDLNTIPPIIGTKALSYYGIFRWRGSYLSGASCDIRISCFCPYPSVTLLHELVHYWQWINGFKPSHDSKFKFKIKSAGLPIADRPYSPDARREDRAREHQIKCDIGLMESPTFEVK
jgi:hypothetical protein